MIYPSDGAIRSLNNWLQNYSFGNGVGKGSKASIASGAMNGRKPCEKT